MKTFKVTSIILVLVLCCALCACGKVDHNYGVESTSSVASAQTKDDDNSKITSLDYKMAQYFDITLFDEENYSEVFLGKKFDINTKYDGVDLALPTKLEDLENKGFKLVEGSDYNKNSLIYAKETVEINFVNENGSKISALFYNQRNISVRFSECPIVKLRINNGYVKKNSDYSPFNVNGITNTSLITDVVQILGTPSHFYKKTETAYYFDYFMQKSDRRNKIRIYVDLEKDAVTAIEISNYKV